MATGDSGTCPQCGQSILLQKGKLLRHNLPGSFRGGLVRKAISAGKVVVSMRCSYTGIPLEATR
jgi:hypothetical protein